MFENSYLNRLALKCFEHPKNLITYLCIDYKCQSSCLFCEECMATYRFKEKHYGHELNVIQINRAMEEISGMIQKNKKITNVIFRQIMACKAHEGLLKWQQEKEQHFTSIEKHINTIKFQVEQELHNIVKKIQQELQIEKQKLYTQLQLFYRNYREKFDKFSRLTEPIVSMNNKYKFFASKNALVFKLSSECDQSKLKNWFNDLKKTLSLTENAVLEPTEYTEDIKKYGQLANEIMDDLPRIRNVDYEIELPNLTNNFSREVLRSFVKLKQNKPSSVCRSISMNSIPSDQIKWKPSSNY